MNARTWIIAAGTLVVAQASAGADQSDWFPFVIPWDDASKTATDVSFLNHQPAGKLGRIVVRNGRFFAEKDPARRPVRFLATNITGPQCFPTKADADRLAAHLAKMGVNLVRIHHLHAGWVEPGLWKPGRKFLEIDPAQLDRFDYLLAALKRRGIYWNINLQTSREYIPEMGLPESVRQIPFDFQKRVDMFDAKMIRLQQDYARKLLARKNPHTGLRYADDPALMVVEINNENTLVGHVWEGLGRGLNTLPEPFSGELKALWNRWLRAKYGRIDALRRAWGAGSTRLGPSLTTSASRWTTENQSNGNVEFRPGAAAAPDVAPAITVRIGSNPGPDWHVQVHRAGLDLKEGRPYTLRFRAKADRPRDARLTVNLDQSNWRLVGLGEKISLGPEWRSYEFAFTVRNTVPKHARVAFILGGSTGTVEIADVALQPGVQGGGLPQDAAFGRINLPGSGTEAKWNDWIDFLADTERDYAETMRGFLRKEIGLRCTILTTQINYGGLVGPYREASMEVADNHAYYQHPVFYERAWDLAKWSIQNRPMTDLMATGAGELGNLAQWRIDGKPYTISEYNHCAPLDAQAEQMPLLSSFAAFHGWDALYPFDYGVTVSGQPNDAIQGWFAHGTNPAKMAFYPAAALLFRQGLVPPATLRTVLEVEPKAWHRFPAAADAWTLAGGFPNPLRTATALRPGAKTRLLTQGKPSASPLSAADGVFRADADRAKVVTGRVAGRTVRLQGAELRFGPIGSGFAALMLVPRDGKPIRSSASLLLTLASRVENQGMGWNEDRSSVGDRWGKGPTICEPVPCTLRLQTDRPVRAFALDGRGRRVRELPVRRTGGWSELQIGKDARTLWFELAAPSAPAKGQR
ncbi:MAG: carbohydrate binding domain-containing protein [Armatimonadetes bacterium]|nr:carbohydrate binding domain-containing protein [Armatimonadota bacterium]